jgi:CheY-like chemotaxis protein
LKSQALEPLVRESLRLLRSLLPTGVRLNTQLHASDLQVLADGTQIQQVLMNLCTNAWQAMDQPSGEITVEVDRTVVDAKQALHLDAIPAGAYARLSVSDTGKGMDESTRRRIFEPFFTTKALGSGTGFGLSVVHGIVKSHRGAIAVHSEPGHGSRFEVYLPMAEATEAAPGEEALSPEPAADLPGQGWHVVYVDDYEAMVFLVNRLLTKSGYRVTTFVSGQEALAWWQSTDEPVDLWVTDQNMPEINGVELARGVRAARPLQRMVIVSGTVDDALLEQAHAAGVESVLGKQTSIEALSKEIHQLLGS